MEDFKLNWKTQSDEACNVHLGLEGGELNNAKNKFPVLPSKTKRVFTSL